VGLVGDDDHPAAGARFPIADEPPPIEVPMGSKGDCFDNALREVFTKTLKWELVDRQSWPTKAELRAAVFASIEVLYNRERLPSRLGYYSPAEFEMIMSPPQVEVAVA
jgi:putative transposase